MVKRYTGRLLYAAAVAAAWGLMAYSVLFNGFSTSLADYYGGTGGLACNQLSGCMGVARCDQGGSITQPCVIACVGGGQVVCLKK